MNPLEDIKLQDLAIMYEFDEVYTGTWAGGKKLEGGGGTEEGGTEGKGKGKGKKIDGSPTSTAGELGLNSREGGLQISMSRVVGARNQRYNLHVTLSNG